MTIISTTTIDDLVSPLENLRDCFLINEAIDTEARVALEEHQERMLRDTLEVEGRLVRMLVELCMCDLTIYSPAKIGHSVVMKDAGKTPASHRERSTIKRASQSRPFRAAFSTEGLGKTR